MQTSYSFSDVKKPFQMYRSKQVSMFPIYFLIFWTQVTLGEAQGQLGNLSKQCQDYCIANQNHYPDKPCSNSIAFKCTVICTACKTICRDPYTNNDMLFIDCPNFVKQTTSSTTTSSTSSSTTTKRPVQQIHEHKEDEEDSDDDLHGNRRLPEDKEDADADEGSEFFAVLVRILLAFNIFAAFTCIFMICRFFKKPEPTEVAPTTAAVTNQAVVIEAPQTQKKPPAEVPAPAPPPPKAVPEAAPPPQTPQQFPPYQWPPPYPYYNPYPPPYASYYPPPYSMPYYTPPMMPPAAPMPAPQPPAIQDTSTRKRNSLQPQPTAMPPRVPESFSPRRDSVPPPMPTQSVTQLYQYDNRGSEARPRENSGSSEK